MLNPQISQWPVQILPDKDVATFLIPKFDPGPIQMHNPEIERAVLQLLPEIGRAERARSELITQHYAGTHVAALGPTRIRDLLLPYLGDPRRKLGPLPGPGIIGPASYSNGQAYIARGSLSSEFAKALTQVGLLGERVVYAKYIRGTWILRPDISASFRHYVFSMHAGNINVRIDIGDYNESLYLPCGLENHGYYIQNNAGERVDIHHRVLTHCDDFGTMHDRHAVHYLSEYTADFLRINIV